MDPHEEQELEESLEFMRKQFQTLTNDIKIPDSLQADLLKKQLEMMEAEQEEAEERARRRKSGGKRVLFPLRAAMGFAACVLVVSVAFLSYQLGLASGGALETASAAPSSAMEEAAEEDIEAQMDTGDPMEAAMGAPTPFDAPMPEEADEAPQPAVLQAAAPEWADAPASADSADGALPESAEVQKGPAARSMESGDAGISEAGAYDAYLPSTLPQGLALASSVQLEDGVSLSYLNEDYSRQIQITLRPVFSGEVVVDPSAPEMYDLRLYTPPYTESVPEELAPTVNNPVFRAEDLSSALVESRIFDSGVGTPRGNFSVLFPGGVVAELNVTGVSASEVYALVASMNA